MPHPPHAPDPSNHTHSHKKKKQKNVSQYRKYPLLFTFALFISFAIASLSWFSHWTKLRPLPPSGGLYFPFTLQLKVPHFSQTDPRWASHYLGHTPGTLAQEGCAVASAAMVLAFRGANITPASLNQFLTHHPRGYTQNGRIWWEDAAEFDPALTTQLLPHYENLPSYALLDLNLFRQNPVIARIRLPSSQTHFVVIVGKKNFDYLVLDPAQSHQPIPLPLANLYPFPIEAIRFYRPR